MAYLSVHLDPCHHSGSGTRYRTLRCVKTRTHFSRQNRDGDHPSVVVAIDRAHIVTREIGAGLDDSWPRPNEESFETTPSAAPVSEVRCPSKRLRGENLTKGVHDPAVDRAEQPSRYATANCGTRPVWQFEIERSMNPVSEVFFGGPGTWGRKELSGQFKVGCLRTEPCDAKERNICSFEDRATDGPIPIRRDARVARGGPLYVSAPLQVGLSSQPARASARGLHVKEPFVVPQHSDLRASLHGFHHWRDGARGTEQRRRVLDELVSDRLNDRLRETSSDETVLTIGKPDAIPGP